MVQQERAGGGGGEREGGCVNNDVNVKVCVIRKTLPDQEGDLLI